MKPPHQDRFPWRLDWNLLRTFMVVSEQRGISNAATFLGLKQPTVSAALKRLELAIGKTLIIRKPNEFVITRAGQVLYAECASIFGTVSQLPVLMDEEAAELRGHLSIAITSSVISEHFDDFLNKFSNAHPYVTYSFSVYESDEIEKMVTMDRPSFGICLLSKLPKNLNAMVLYKEYFGLFCGARHQLFNVKNIISGDLEGEPFVAFQTEDEGGPLEVISLLRNRLNLSRDWRGVSSSLNEIRRMIMANVGIGALPLHVAQNDVVAGRLRQLPPYENLPLVSIHLISNPARRFSEVESTFLASIEAELSTIGISERTYGIEKPRFSSESE